MNKLGYILMHRQHEDYLGFEKTDEDKIIYAYTKRPELSKVFLTITEAYQFMHEHPERDLEVCRLMDNDDQYFVYRLSEVFQV